MKQITYICDLCKDKVEEKDVKQIKNMDFCPDCYDEIADEISIYIAKVEKERQDSAAAEKKAARESKKKKAAGEAIDAGKAQALKNAGWTPEQIAEELKTTPEKVEAVTTTPVKKKRKPHEWD